MVAKGRDRWLHDVRKECRKRKGLACVTLQALTICTCAKQIRLTLEEAEVSPCRDQPVPGEDECCVGSEEQAGEGVHCEKDGWEMLDSHFDHSLVYADGMFGHQLFQGDEECRLQGDASIDGCGSSCRIAGHGSPQNVCRNSQQVGYYGSNENNIDQASRSPGSFKIFPAKIDGGSLK